MVGFGSQGEPQQKAECSGAHPLVAWGTEVCFSFSSPASVRDVRVARGQLVLVCPAEKRRSYAFQ